MIFGKKKTIVTHSGRFHADDLFATAMILEYLKGDANVVRSVDPKIIEKADYVIDIGRIYDPSNNRFDHHQGGVGARTNGLSYASAGLIWKHFGEKISGSKEIADRIDEKLVMSIDAHDTGDVSPKPFFKDIYPYFLDDMAGAFGNTWQETGRNETESFKFLLPFARAILNREITKVKASIAAESLTLAAYERAADKRLIIMDTFLPLGTFDMKEDVLFVVCPEPRSGGWAVRTMRKNKHEYGNRKDLPKEWARRKRRRYGEEFLTFLMHSFAT